MSIPRDDVRFVVLPMAGRNAHASEFGRTMAPHPLVYQEIPYDPQYTIYNRRLTALVMSNGSADDAYWKLRRQAILRHTGELPVEVRGPDAERLLNLVFTRDVAKVRVGRCSYQFACYDDGGMILDGVLVRLADDRYWYGQADGDLSDWLKAHGRGMDVDILDPDVWISQVQGPDSLKILAAAVDGAYPDPFRYFDAARVTIAGQEVVVTRSGFTNELGWEVYLEPDTDARAVGERILEAGRPCGMRPVAVGGARRIEAGLLNAGSDFDETVTPFAAGLGAMVDLDKPDFIGKAALQNCDRRNRTWGMRVPGGVARLGDSLSRDGVLAGRVCSTAWSPFQQCGVAIVRLDDPDLGPGTVLDVACQDDKVRPAETCALPMYDPKGEIPRGRLVDIPDVPRGGEIGQPGRPGA
ncbi:aminomethyl transferase family protein [Nitratireductor mangrovi]|uniref:Aminomethyl transferase family protein n=1 Tax=Nitratireductor mangrovi TaxID=2599600 RepID=A0A5B8L100_9HYPH|nr:aminomethyltransferase family protein [Nitratireductor mangrovi]QDZ01360.1 aminomethyl transferase family protein [Nitratireductor mangrovi]